MVRVDCCGLGAKIKTTTTMLVQDIGLDSILKVISTEREDF